MEDPPPIATIPSHFSALYISHPYEKEGYGLELGFRARVHDGSGFRVQGSSSGFRVRVRVRKKEPKHKYEKKNQSEIRNNTAMQ
jgi:hypothetical protein